MPHFLAILLSLLCAVPANAGEGKLLGSAGLLSLDGSAGGGLVPWATTAGYGERGEWGSAAAYSSADTGELRLHSAAFALSYDNRVEVSVARQQLRLRNRMDAKQNLLGAKVRVYGDLIYGNAPQFAMGVQHKRHADPALLSMLEVDARSGTDIYFAASKLWLAGPGNRHWLANFTLRNTSAQQVGFLGFAEQRDWQAEASVAVFLNRYWAVGTEYRQKPDRLSGLPEDDWTDLFVAWFPNKKVSLVCAWLDLGSVLGSDPQRGVFLSVQVQP